MGGTSKQEQQQQQTQTRNPWDPAVPLVSGIAQQGAGLLTKHRIEPAGKCGVR